MEAQLVPGFRGKSQPSPSAANVPGRVSGQFHGGERSGPNTSSDCRKDDRAVRQEADMHRNRWRLRPAGNRPTAAQTPAAVGDPPEDRVLAVTEDVGGEHVILDPGGAAGS